LLAGLATLMMVIARRGSFGAHRSLVGLYGAIAIAAAALSFGPEVRTADGTALAASPYSWLRESIPGFAAVRAPGRFAMIVSLGLAVLGAVIAARAFAWLGPNARASFMALALGVVSVEAFPVRLEIEPIEPSGRVVDREVYAWLARQPPSALLELPATPHDAQVENVELFHQFATLQHPHALVNGYSGFNPPLAEWLETPDSPFIDATRVDEGVMLMRSIHVRFVVVHTHDYADPALAASIVRRMRQLPSIADEHRFRDHHVFELLPD
jgi:hypothetical protein